MKNCWPAIICLACLAACTPADKPKDAPAQNETTTQPPTLGAVNTALVGSWQLKSQEMDMPSPMAGQEELYDSLQHGLFARSQRLRRQTLTLHSNGQYQLSITDLKDKPLMEQRGHWGTRADSLFVWYAQPRTRLEAYRYRITAQGQLYTQGRIDADGDGAQDDDWAGMWDKK